MAYRSFREFGDIGDDRPSVREDIARAAPHSDLTPLEWTVVAIARKDGPASLVRPGRVANALRSLFARRNPRLADSRLEALRRIAVLTWQHGYTVPAREVRAFIEAGFSADQYETLVDRISISRIIPPRTVTA